MYEFDPNVIILGLIATHLIVFLLGYYLDHSKSKRVERDAEYALKDTQRQRDEYKRHFEAAAVNLQNVNDKIARGEIYTKYDLSTAVDMGQFVDAFRVFRTLKGRSKIRGREEDRTEVVGFTENYGLARTYVEKWDNVHSDFTLGYSVEAVRLFKLPTGEYLKALPFIRLPELKPRDLNAERKLVDRGGE